MEDPMLASTTNNSNKIKADEHKRPFQCEICSVRFGSQENLESHKLIHQSDGVLKCNICQKQFPTITGLMAHNIVHSSKKFKCQLCDVWVKTSGNMKEHMKVHKGLIFKCSHCGKDFNKIGNLRMHEKRHTKTLPQFHCDLCPRVFHQKCLVKYHMRTHNGDRPFKCTACDAAFADKSNLRKHYRIHSGEKPFDCDQCDKSFNQRSSLTCHKRTHVTFKPHECQHCGKRFGLNEELIVHLRVHGENKNFTCPICDDTFVEHCYLKSHMRIHNMISAGNKSVEVFKTADINTEEPTCLISVDGDVNNLESIVLKRRPKERKQVQRRAYKRKSNPDEPSSTASRAKRRKRSANNATIVNKNTSLIDDTDKVSTPIEEDIKETVSEHLLSEVSTLPMHEFKTEIKEESNSIEETTIPFVNVSIKVEPGDLIFAEQNHEIDEESTDHSNFEFATHSFDSDSEDEKPLSQRVDCKRLANTTASGQTTRKPLSQFKDIIESAFPVVLIERQHDLDLKAAKIKIKSEQMDDLIEPNVRSIKYKKPRNNRMENKAKKPQSSQNGEDETYLYECSYCSKKLKTWANVIMHEQIHRKTTDCPTCHCKCSTVLDLIKHIKETPDCSRKNATNWTCTICNDGVHYRTKAALDYHTTKHSGQRPFACDICDKTFRSKETLRQHMKRHENIKNYNCEVCGRQFPNKSHLQQHQLSHTDAKPFQCDICNNFFKSQGRLYNHKRIHMKPQYSCCYCSRQFTIVGNLKIHEMRHMRDEMVKKFKCEVKECGKEFLLKHDLKYHMRKHNGERPYACNLCPARFADISNLHKHTKIHTGSKPYVCHCGKSYNQQSSLNTHKKTHLVATLIEKYLCTHCPKKFALEEDLTLHLRTHGIHSMFKCNFCEREYELLNHLRSHRRIHLNLYSKRNKFLWPEKVGETNSVDVNSETAIKVDQDSLMLC